MALKRNENLKVLSREHHYGLLFCWKIRQGLKKSIPIERMRPFVEYFWDNHLADHFKKEEQQVFNHGENKLYAKAEDDHQLIKNSIKDIIANSVVAEADLASLADIVEQHIRFEERSLFPSIQENLSEHELAEIGANLGVEDDLGADYADEFWLSK